MYSQIEKKLKSGEVIVLDGGTGTDIQRRGGAMSGETWCADANLTHPDIVREVHEDYIRAGAELITANTFATSALLFNALGRDADLLNIDQAAVAHRQGRGCKPSCRRRGLGLHDAARGRGQRPHLQAARMAGGARPAPCSSARWRISPGAMWTC